MAKKYTVPEALEVLKNGPAAEKMGLIRRYPLFATASLEDILGTLSFVTARKIEKELKKKYGVIGAVDEDVDIDLDDEEETKKVKKAKKDKGKGKPKVDKGKGKGKKSKDEDDDDDIDLEDLFDEEEEEEEEEE